MIREGDSDSVVPSYHGPGASLFWLMLGTTLLNVLTLGLYRFWQRTKLRRHYWNGIRVAGSPLEYSGTGLEKFLGFLIAVVFLAVYLGLFQIGFFFLGLQLSGGSDIVGLFSALPVVPLLFYAQYRARRYQLSRTQLRGIRFAMRPAALAYTGRAMVHLLYVVPTLGLLWPRMHWHLEKFRADRTHFGSLHLLQGGRWQPMLRPWLFVLFTSFLPYGLSLALLIADRPVAAGLSALLLLLSPFALAHYNVVAFRVLTEGKSLGSITFRSDARTGTVIAIHMLAYLLIAVIGSVMLTVGLALYGLLGGESVSLAAMVEIEAASDIPTGLIALIGGILLVNVLLNAPLLAVFITQPVLAHYVETLTVENAWELDEVRQRALDDFAEADGFADALDAGGAF